MSEVKERQRALQVAVHQQEAAVVQKTLAEPPAIEQGEGLLFLMDGGTGGMQRCECGKVAAKVCFPVK